MYYCRVVYVLLYIPMKTDIGGGGVSMDPRDPPLNPPLVCACEWIVFLL